MAKNKRIAPQDIAAQDAEHTMNTPVNEEEATAQVMFKMTPTQKASMTKRAKSKGLTNAGYLKSLIFEDGGFN